MQKRKRAAIRPAAKSSNADGAGGDKSPATRGPQRQAIPQILSELEEACKRIGVRLTYEAIGGELGSGGLCKVKGQWRAIFDKRTTPSERVALLAPLVSRFPLDDVAFSEPVRELLASLRAPQKDAEQSLSAAQ